MTAILNISRVGRKRAQLNHSDRYLRPFRQHCIFKPCLKSRFGQVEQERALKKLSGSGAIDRMGDRGKVEVKRGLAGLVLIDQRDSQGIGLGIQ
ncbi:hypothetical protein LJU32_19210 [Pseudomonas sp. B21_DOA]|nr:hypothetical protein LJU32_19210 [Pseudomonas sp. B21_DOA]